MDSAKQTSAAGFLGEKLKERKKNPEKVKRGRVRDGNKSTSGWLFFSEYKVIFNHSKQKEKTFYFWLMQVQTRFIKLTHSLSAESGRTL